MTRRISTILPGRRAALRLIAISPFAFALTAGSARAEGDHAHQHGHGHGHGDGHGQMHGDGHDQMHDDGHSQMHGEAQSAEDGHDHSHSASKMSKEEASYQPTPKNGQKCSGCIHYTEDGKCHVVAGDVAADGWCTLWADA